MILDVPYQSQLPLETTEEKKWCGIASLQMILSFYLKEDAPSAQELLDKYGVEFESNGSQHKDLLKIARDYNLRGFRKSWWVKPGDQNIITKFKEEGESEDDIRSWMETNTQESFFTVRYLLDQGLPVIASVSSEFSPSNSTHLVVIIGYKDNEFIIHDPNKKGESFKIPQKELEKYWLRQIIVVQKPD